MAEKFQQRLTWPEVQAASELLTKGENSRSATIEARDMHCQYQLLLKYVNKRIANLSCY
jgi:hypothetical protein